MAKQTQDACTYTLRSDDIFCCEVRLANVNGIRTLRTHIQNRTDNEYTGKNSGDQQISFDFDISSAQRKN